MDKEKGLLKTETSLSLFSVMCTVSMTINPHSNQERDHPSLYPNFQSKLTGDKKKKILIMVLIKL